MGTVVTIHALELFQPLCCALSFNPSGRGEFAPPPDSPDSDHLVEGDIVVPESNRETKTRSTMAWQTGGTLTFNNPNDVVCHVVGSSAQKAPGASSWKDYWMTNTGKVWPQTCQFHQCGNEAQLGAHIYANQSKENFILPSCIQCNNDKSAHYHGSHAFRRSVKINAVAAWVNRHPNTY